MISYMCCSLLLSSFVYPTVTHAVWSRNGVFSIHAKEPFRGIGCIDFSGAGVVHVLGGLTALIAATIMGPRKGRFHDAEGNVRKTPKDMPGQSISLQLLGTLILWFGWYGFNAGKKILVSESTCDERHPPVSNSNTTIVCFPQDLRFCSRKRKALPK